MRPPSPGSPDPQGGQGAPAPAGLALVMAAAVTWGTTSTTMALLGRRNTSAIAAGIGSLLEPLTASVLGVIVFGESFGAPGVAGAALLLAAVALLFSASRPVR